MSTLRQAKAHKDSGRRLPVWRGLNPALAGLLATVAFVGWNSWINRSAYLEEFAANARERAEQVKALYAVQLTRQQGVTALFAVSAAVDARDFRNFVRVTETGTANTLVSMALVQQLPTGDRSAFERALRRDYGAANAHIVSSSDRPVLLAMRYAEPVHTDLSFPGFDLGVDPEAAEAVAKSERTGRVTHAAVRAGPADSTRSAFRLFTPMSNGRVPGLPPQTRRAARISFICGTYRYDDLLEVVFSRTSHLGQHVLAYDSETADSLPVYAHRSRQSSEVPLEPRLRYADLSRYGHRIEEHVALADDRFLTLVFVPIRSTTLLAHIDHRGRMIVFGGALISVLLAYLGRRLATGRAQRDAAEERLRLAATVFHDAQEGIAITDAAGDIIDVNGTFSQITGYPRDEVLGKNPRMLKSGIHDGAFYRDFWQTLTKEGVWRGEFWNRHRSGNLVAVQATVSAVRDNTGRISHFIDLFSDITDRKTQQERIEHLAFFDALTDLPNRALLLDRLEQALARARRDDTMVCVAYLDLDGFKPVNDTHGHKAGDLLLCEIALRLKASVREHDTVCRLGGDEFVLILAGLRSWEECEKILARTLQNISRPCALPIGEIVTVSGSIGVTLSPPDRSTADILLRHADQAMYIAKRAGRNRMHRFATPPDQAPAALSAQA